MLYRSLVILSILATVFISEMCTDDKILNENPIEKPIEGEKESQEESKEETKIRTSIDSEKEKNTDNFKSDISSFYALESEGYLLTDTPPPRD